jgi:5-methyltetrahydrofolate--homocysteine methyltransferase
MKTMLERIHEGEILIADGAMGTQLQARGLPPGDCPELWCLTHPDVVQAIHRAYAEVGSDIVECNSFGASRYKLRHYGLADRVGEINRAAARLAREVADGRQYVLGSVGPTGAFLEPVGDESAEAFATAFREQIEALEAGGADAVIVETMTAIEEAAIAIRMARAHTALTVLASFTFDPQPSGDYATMMGVTPERAVEAALEAGAHIVGANCGTGGRDMVAVIRRMKAAAAGAVPLLAMPNAGMPVLEGGRTIFRETPEETAAYAVALVEAGVSVIGGCCGTGPEHIRAIRRAIRKS